MLARTAQRGTAARSPRQRRLIAACARSDATTTRARITARAIAKQRTSAEGQEGLRAFLERRPRHSLGQRRVIRRLSHRQSRRDRGARRARGARDGHRCRSASIREADANAYHLQFMDDARCVGPAPAAESYLNIDAVIAAAIDMKADAVHPGYGFLSERAAFAQAVRRCRA